jgi:hypothetical protein
VQAKLEAIWVHRAAAEYHCGAYGHLYQQQNEESIGEEPLAEDIATCQTGFQFRSVI